MIPSHASSPLPSQEEDDLFSLNSLLLILKRRWPWLLLCALLGAAAAYYYAAKQGYVYEKKASVLLRNERQQEVGASERILKELGAETGASNMANETFVMKSTPIMLEVVNDLKLNVSYWKKQDIRLLDVDEETPLLVDFIKINPQRSCALTITPLNEEKYTLSYVNRKDHAVFFEGTFNEPLELPFATIRVSPTTLLTKEQMGLPLLVQRSPKLQTAQELLSVFKVERPEITDSSLLLLSLKSTNPQKTARVLNKIIDVYNQFSKDEKTKAAEKTKEFIAKLMGELDQDLKAVSSSISDFKKKSDLVHETTPTLDANFTVLQQLEKDIFEIKTQIKLTENLAGSLKNAERKSQLLSVETGISDSGISKQIELYNEAYLEYKKIAVSAGARNPLVIDLKGKMESSRAAINRSISNYQNNLDLRLTELTKKKDELDLNMISTADKAKVLEPLIQELKSKEGRYQMLLSKKDENELSLYLAEPSARILETAYGSDLPVAPRVSEYVIIGAGGGLVSCFLVFLLVSMADVKVWNKQDMQTVSTVPVIGELPVLSEKERKERKFGEMNDRSVFSEYFHILRNNVATFVPQENDLGQVIVLTSTMPAEGKTDIVKNLSAAFALTGKKVLMIDGDLRKVSLSKQMGGRGKKGLSNILLNPQETVDSLICHCPESDNLDILYGGPIPPNAALLLTNARLELLLQKLRTRYDKIIIDAPPYGILADASLLSVHADMTLYVVRSGKIEKRFFSNIQHIYEEGKLKNLAYIINAVDFKRARYRHCGYGYGYRYMEEKSS